ncbi:hypothetical protein QR680_004024 [Steinernema hermaphroditum]|uniref:Uncharacterized protein n=1 Tax=Steinernema hermaphroditum TaxID=289476 RepID=A0AA39HME8_9BILA|nr:hypothetical protein QR680_004024 [Steinernema hermaphroditum]
MSSAQNSLNYDVHRVKNHMKWEHKNKGNLEPISQESECRDEINDLNESLGYYILLLSSFLEFFASFGYLYFSALTIFLAYVGYAKPLLFPVLTKTRNVVFMFAFGHIWASIAVVTLFPRNIPVVFLGMSADIDFSSVMIVQVFIVIFLYMAMVVLFVLTIVKMRQHAVNVIGNASVSAVHRRVLKSMLIYCTLPNVFAGIALPTYIYSTILEVNGFTRPSHWANTAEMRAWKSTDYLSRPFAGLSYSTGNIRLLANVFTALIAFHDYRVAMKKGLRRIVVPILNAMKISKHNTSIVTFYVDPLFHIPSSRTHVRDARCG